MSDDVAKAVSEHPRRGADLLRHALASYLGLPPPIPVRRGRPPLTPLPSTPPRTRRLSHLQVPACRAALQACVESYRATPVDVRYMGGSHLGIEDNVGGHLLREALLGLPQPFALHPAVLATHDGTITMPVEDVSAELAQRRYVDGAFITMREVCTRLIDEALVRRGIYNRMSDARGQVVIPRDAVVHHLTGPWRLTLSQLCWRLTPGRARYSYLKHQMVRRGLWEAWIQGRVDYATEHGQVMFSAAPAGTPPRRELEQTRQAEADIYAIPYAPAG